MRNEKTGIYGIRCSANNKLYVGSSANIYTRWSQHRTLLRKSKHHTPYLQNAWNKYGESAFDFYVIEECEKSQLECREQHYVDTLKPAFNGFTNVRSRTGPEARAKLAAKTRARSALLTHCPKGHEYTPENTYIGKRSKHICRTCNAERVAAIFASETPEQRELRRVRAKDYYERTKDMTVEARCAYAESHREEKRAYDRSRREITREQARLHREARTPEQQKADCARKRERYAASLGRPLIPQADRMTDEARAKISATLKAKRTDCCLHGHPRDEINMRVTKSGKIECRTCRSERKKAKRATMTAEERAAHLASRRERNHEPEQVAKRQAYEEANRDKKRAYYLSNREFFCKRARLNHAAKKAKELTSGESALA